MPSLKPSASAVQTIPFLYRLLIQTIEPIFTIGGSYVGLTQLNFYLHSMTRGAVTLAPNANFIGTQLVGGWMFFAFTEAVVLRAIDDLNVWQWIIYGMLLSDVAYCHSVAQAVGGWGEFVKVQNWTVDDWTVTLMTLPFVLSRVCIALGIGLKKAKRE
ncbi:hypothetical protein EJ05DRAFT_476980 [Pseudovirgaria hyperparasitica]|uniref:DUF7704 domain-containing protein n=1 Tax=Pseudovirgaria hyperparasitica TaxID=470096 RepID=A0A6A6W9K1_9PEZI|nr:uncharacterized protein EJ05DRAFT_476980 [Pseudovirgaria hyperparasitica]KAF2757771.1 hypothetical protein EJ05DRAFT_476980 [Pseudovirgaria hyperparasitica]